LTFHEFAGPLGRALLSDIISIEKEIDRVVEWVSVRSA
jgi:hypothetical protein